MLAAHRVPVTGEELLLNGKVALVTGAGSGIGRAIAQQLSAFGAFVVIVEQDPALADQTLAAISAAGGQGAVIAADVAEESQLTTAIHDTATGHGRLDILVNNAAIYPHAAIDELTGDQWNRVVAVNLRAPFVAMREAGRVMTEGGVIINISSVDSLRPSSAGLGHYGATKAALNALTRSASVEFGPRGIRVNAVLPGVICTRDLPSSHPSYATWANRSVIKRIGMPFDIAGAVLFLAGPLAAFIHGQTLVVDGGITAVA